VATSKEPRDRSHRHTRVPEVRVDLLPESETGNMIDSGLGGKSAEYFDALVRLFSDAPRRRFDRLSLRWISGQRRSAGTSVRIRTLTEAGHGPNGKAAGTQRQPSRSARLVWPPPAPIRAHNSTISAARWDSASHVRRRLTAADDGRGLSTAPISFRRYEIPKRVSQHPSGQPIHVVSSSGSQRQRTVPSVKFPAVVDVTDG
jgi:hypothetical protein